MTKSQKQDSINVTNLEREYRTLLTIAINLSSELVNQLNRLLDVEGIALGFPIQHRVKSWESLTEKFDRLSLRVESMKDVQDLVGLRLILLYRRDVEKVCQLISKNFKVVRQYDTRERLKEDQFGYSSIHFVVELPQEWLAVPTLAPLAGCVQKSKFVLLRSTSGLKHRNHSNINKRQMYTGNTRDDLSYLSSA
jgi:putative GTP pyrophosphokinase